MCGEGLEKEGEKGGALDHGSLTFSMEGQLTVKSQGRVESEWRGKTSIIHQSAADVVSFI